MPSDLEVRKKQNRLRRHRMKTERARMSTTVGDGLPTDRVAIEVVGLNWTHGNGVPGTCGANFRTVCITPHKQKHKIMTRGTCIFDDSKTPTFKIRKFKIIVCLRTPPPPFSSHTPYPHPFPISKFPRNFPSDTIESSFSVYHLSGSI